MRPDVKLDPWSDKISSGNPSLAKVSHNASATVVASVLLRGMASGYRVAKSIIVKIYLFPLFVLRSGPTMSMAIHLKGSFIVGSGCRGARCLMAFAPL